MSHIVGAPLVDRSLFSLHEEEHVVEVPPHRRQIEYLESNLRVERPERFVIGNIGVYWVPGQFESPWIGPDLLVSQHPPRQPPPRVYLLWEDGPILFVAEVASERTRRAERAKREQVYRTELQVPEYLYIDLDRHELELWRLRQGEYHRVEESEGRLYSEGLDVWFGWGKGEEFVRIWTPEGRMLLTKEEEWAARQAAEARIAELASELERLRRSLEGRADDVAP